MLCEAKTYNINVFLEEEWPHIFDQESAVLGRFLTPQTYALYHAYIQYVDARK